MKKIMLLLTIIAVGVIGNSVLAQDKSKRPSPPAVAAVTLENGTKISINYSQPSVKGRTIGKDLEPKQGEIWRTGANEATVFEVTQNVTVEGQQLEKGKYALFTLFEGEDCTIIFNKVWKQWGAYEYKAEEDILRIKVKAGKGEFSEKLNFTINQEGKVALNWGELQVEFAVK